MIITSKRKLTSSVAILCALMILIGIFPMNLFSRNKADAANSWTVYFDISNTDWFTDNDYVPEVSTDHSTWNDMTLLNGKIYSYTFDSKPSSVYFARGIHNGETIYGKTTEQTISDKNYFLADSWVSNSNNNSGTWKTYKEKTIYIDISNNTVYQGKKDSIYLRCLPTVGNNKISVSSIEMKYFKDNVYKATTLLWTDGYIWFDTNGNWENQTSDDDSVRNPGSNNYFTINANKESDNKYKGTWSTYSESLAGKTINFKDMTDKLNSNITAIFTGDEITTETKNVENNKVTIPNDVNNNSYKTVEFKNGTTSLGKYNLFNESSSGVTAISYDESTCNTFYYGAVEKISDGSTISYWGAEPSTASSSINSKKLYLENTFFDTTSGNAPTITINDSTGTFAKDSDDDSTYSYTINTSATQQNIISITYKNIRYNFLWSDLSKNKLSINGSIASISDVYSNSNGLNLYFDATLSKLSYSGSTTNNATMPAQGDNQTIFAHLFNNSKNTSKDYKMEKLPSKTIGSNTWSDVYYVNISNEDLNSGDYDQVVFSIGTDTITWPDKNTSLASQTEDLDLPKNTNKTCFYADSSDKCIYNNNKRSGYWDKVYTIRDAESGKNSTVVDIKESSFSAAKKSYKSNNEEVHYVNSTFYDYYTDYELNGSNRDDYKETNGASQRNWVTFRQFDQALSDLYSENNVSIPIYTGHFQPSYSNWTTKFTDISNTLNLYGFNKNTGTDAYKSFMSTNNSTININGNGEFYDSAAQGLVNGQLDNGNLKTSKGEVNLPHFDEDFLLGNNSKNTKLAGIYKNVSFPFTKQDVDNNGVDYWVFDSKDTTLAMRKNNDSSGNGNYYLQKTSNTGWSTNVNSGSASKNISGFFPFNETSTATHANTYNYGFGTKLEFKFRLTKDGKVLDKNGNPVDIKFLFSGDDDVWVFIDGKLALDVGGAHGQVTGTIDFGGTDNTKTSTVSKVKASAGSSTSGTEITSNFKLEGSNTDEHTLVMYYMERGMWESNMRVQFNFPDENQLEVEKQVDTTDVNAMFKNLFNENENFEFLIQNRVTHFGEKEASDSTELKTIDFAKDFTGNLSATSASNKFEKVDNKNGQNNVVHWWAMYSNTNNAFTKERLGDLSADDKQPKDINEMTYLTFKAYIANSNPSLNNMYIQLTDKNSKKLYGFLDANKVKDTVLNGNTWSKVTVILDKLTEESGFDKTNISTISFQYNIQCDIYLDDFIFKNDATSTSTGFTTKQEEIPDYGSATSGKLENAENAQYYKKNDSSTSSKGTLGLVDESGNFYLKNKQLVTFYDQFRRGSYISLTENLSESQKKLYTTTYTVYEDGSAVTSMSTGDKVTNGNINNLKDVSSTQVEDGRIEKTDSDSTAANYDGTKPTGNTLVFRSYANPDDNTNTKLKVQFNNKVNVGKLTITKAQTGNVNLTGKYSFYVEFKNVGGSGLEGANSIVSDVIELGVGESKTITGIPVGTEYIIHEVDDNSEGAVLKTVTSDGKDVTISQNTVNDMATHSVTGIVTIADTEYSYIFNNAKIETIELNITKKWFNVNEADEDKYIPTANAVNFRLLRSTDGSTWETVPNYESFTLDSDWKKKITKLDKYADDEQTQWKYSIRELDQEGNQIDNGGMTTIAAASGDVNYTVTYTTGNNSADYDSELIVDNTRVIQNISMPETGGEGGSPNQFNFVLFGAIAIALAGGLLLLNKKYAFVHIGKSSKEVR